MRSLARGGRLVTCGATSGPRVGLDLRVLFARQISLRGSYMGTKRELLRAAALFFDGRLAPALDEVFPLARRPTPNGGSKRASISARLSWRCNGQACATLFAMGLARLSLGLFGVVGVIAAALGRGDDLAAGDRSRDRGRCRG